MRSARQITCFGFLVIGIGYAAGYAELQRRSGPRVGDVCEPEVGCSAGACVDGVANGARCLEPCSESGACAQGFECTVRAGPNAYCVPRRWSSEAAR